MSSIQVRHWPTLYKTSASTGKVMEWKIWTEGPAIRTRYGYVGQKKQDTIDPVLVGKNIGKKSETTPQVQAELEAASRYKKYLDRGYAPKGEESNVECVFPMLAQEYTKQKKEINFPAIAQPKYDGVRMLSYNGKVFLSRRGKPLSIPKALEKQLLKVFPDVIVDGELYNHEYKEDFSKIISATRTTKKKADNLDLIQYHIYDLVLPDVPYRERNRQMAHMILSRGDKNTDDYIKMAPSLPIKGPKDLDALFEKWLSEGYEGAMYRDPNSHYEVDKRSRGLLKYKPVYDGEFEIVSVVEGRGRLKGHVGEFVCAIHDEHGYRTFGATMKGQGITEFLKKAWEKKSVWKNKWMHIEYSGITSANKVPRHARGLKILDDPSEK